MTYFNLGGGGCPKMVPACDPSTFLCGAALVLEQPLEHECQQQIIVQELLETYPQIQTSTVAVVLRSLCYLAWSDRHASYYLHTLHPENDTQYYHHFRFSYMLVKLIG